MGRKRKLVDKYAFKKSSGKCYFCSINDYALLDVHRIIPGEKNGEYTNVNSLCVCSNCHRRIHNEQIIIDRKYQTSSGCTILHYWENGEEKWL
jgi:hypothetical protein